MGGRKQNQIVDRIVRDSGIPELVEVLTGKLSPTDLQSLLLEVYRRRAAGLTPAAVLRQYQENRFVRSATVPPEESLELDRSE